MHVIYNNYALVENELGSVVVLQIFEHVEGLGGFLGLFELKLVELKTGLNHFEGFLDVAVGARSPSVVTLPDAS